MAKYRGTDIIEVGQPELNPELITGRVRVPDSTPLGPQEITSEMLKEGSPITIPPPPSDTNNYLGIINGGQALSEVFRQSNVAPQQTDLRTIARELSGEYGLEEKETKAGESQKQLDLLNAQMAALTAEAQAVPIQLQKEFEGRGATVGGVKPIETSRLRDIALRSLPLQGQILAQQAIATGDQRALQAAQSKFNTMFQLQAEQVQMDNEYRREQRDRIYDYLTKAEQRRVDQLNREDDRKFDMFKFNSQQRSDLVAQALSNNQADVAAGIAALDPNSPTFTQDISGWTARLQVPMEAAQAEKLSTQVVELPDGTKALINTQTGDVIKTYGVAGEEGAPLPISPYQQERATRNLQSISELETQATQSPQIFGRTAALRLPGFLRSDAFRNFSAQLETLKSNIAFGELTAMREASKTGGALGQVSDKEAQLLQNALGALNMSQSPDNFKLQLQKIRDSITRWQKAVTQSGGAVSQSPTTTKSGKPFDYAGAKAAGYSDAEITAYLNAN